MSTSTLPGLTGEQYSGKWPGSPTSTDPECSESLNSLIEGSARTARHAIESVSGIRRSTIVGQVHDTGGPKRLDYPGSPVVMIGFTTNDSLEDQSIITTNFDTLIFDAIQGEIEKTLTTPDGNIILTLTGDSEDRSFVLVSPTVQQQSTHETKKSLEALFREAKELEFEDGMENEFSRKLLLLIGKQGNLAIDALTELIPAESISPFVSSEALRWLGRIRDASTYENRLGLLEKSITCSSAVIRDGALLGLASLDDPHAIPYLEKARDKESYRDLRKDMQQVLEQLKETLKCRPSLEKSLRANGEK